MVLRPALKLVNTQTSVAGKEEKNDSFRIWFHYIAGLGCLGLKEYISNILQVIFKSSSQIFTLQKTCLILVACEPTKNALYN
jgi:hypothetical protein